MQTKSDLKEGVKFDEDKTRYDLVPTYPLEQLAKVYTYGAKKYADHNWRKGIKFSRIYSAILRHLEAIRNGELVDPESGLPHAAHAALGCFSLIQYTKPGNSLIQFNDLYPEDK